MNEQPVFEFKNVTVRRKDALLVDRVNLTVREHENTVILGPNGSGKTTLIKLIASQYAPVYRRDLVCRLFGMERWDLFALRRKIGLVTSDLQVDYCRKGTRGVDVILSGFFGSHGLYSNMKVLPVMRRKAADLMAVLGIAGLGHQPISHMSTGEARMFLIGRALVHDPAVLLLDEPTASLDIRARNVFRSRLQDLIHRGHSLIIVTHDIHDVIPEISRVVMIKDGRVFADGAKRTVLTTERLSHLFDYPVTVHRSNGYYSVAEEGEE